MLFTSRILRVGGGRIEFDSLNRCRRESFHLRVAGWVDWVVGGGIGEVQFRFTLRCQIFSKKTNEKENERKSIIMLMLLLR